MNSHGSPEYRRTRTLAPHGAAWIACALILFAAVRPAGAFEEFEHEHLGNWALRIAIDFMALREMDEMEEDKYWKMSKAQRCEQYKPETRFLPECKPPKTETVTVTYGAIVRLVDYMAYPREIFEVTNERGMPQQTIGLPKDFGELNKSVMAEDKAKSILTFARSATNNEYHFQAGLFNLMTRFHEDAISYSQRGNLFAALVANAISDHFLHDFFAPGHITTTRENSHDAVALGMHDKVNKNGAGFVIDQKKWERDLAPLLEFVKKNHDAGRYGNDLLLGSWDEEATADFIADMEKHHEGIQLVGDDLLRGVPKQQLFMLLVEVQSILDVLEARKADKSKPGGVRNSFEEYKWTGTFDYRKSAPEKPTMTAAIAYGYYSIDPILFAKASNIFIGSIGGQAPISGFGSSRLLVSAEIVPIAVIASSKFLRQYMTNKPTQYCDNFSLCNFVPAIGVVFVEDDEFSAAGPSLRLIKVFPKISTQISLYYYSLKYDHPINERRSSFGVRFDTGFSLYSVYVAVGKGFAVKEANDLEADTVISFGLAFGMPFSRIPLLR